MKQPPPAPGMPPEPPPRTISAVYFQSSVALGGELQSAAVGQTVDSVEWGSIGVFLFRSIHDRTKNARFIASCFVPWSNIRAVKFADAPIAE